LALVPANYQQILELRRQQFAPHAQEPSLQYEKALANLSQSIVEWRDWRQRHPGSGTMQALRAQAHWLVPLFAIASNPLLLGAPWVLTR
jgi:hypothetical protein